MPPRRHRLMTNPQLTRFWPLLAMVGAVVLALLGQQQLKHGEERMLLALACFLSAGALLKMADSYATAIPRISAAGWSSLGICGLSFLLTLFVLRQPTEYIPYAVLAWVTSMAAFLGACWCFEQQQSTIIPLHFQWSRADIGWMVVGLATAISLRVTFIDHAPITVSNDEMAMTWEASQVLQETGRNPFVTGWLGHPTLWFFLQAASLRLFGDHYTSTRLLSALAGSMTIPLTYLLGRLLFTRQIAVIGSLLLATYHFHIHYSRLALNNVLDPFFGVLLVSLLFIAVRTGRVLFVGLTGITLGLTLYFYPGARLFYLLIPLLATLGLAAQLQWGVTGSSVDDSARPWLWSSVTKSALLSLLGIMVAAGPLIQHFLTHPDTFTARFRAQGITWTWLQEEAERRGQTAVAVLLAQFRDGFLIFTSHGERYAGFYDETRPLVWGAAAVLMLLGIVVALLRIKYWSYQIVIVWFLLGIIGGGMLMIQPRGTPRYVGLAPVVCLFVAIATDRILQPVQITFSPHRSLAPILAATIVLYLSYVSVTSYFLDYVRRDTIGGTNTHFINAMARQLSPSDPPVARVWFLGAPRMYYEGWQTLKLMLPSTEGIDVIDPILAVDQVPPPPDRGPTAYVVIPERMAELQLIRQHLPDGRLIPLQWPPTKRETIGYIYLVSRNNVP